MKNMKSTFTRKEKINVHILGFITTYADFIFWGLFISTVIYKAYC